MANSIQLFSVRLHNDVFDDNSVCHAMFIGLQGVIGDIGSLLVPTTFKARGISVPISRGRPPTRDV